MEQLQLDDPDLDHQLLALAGRSLVIFTGAGCASCRWARQQLPDMPLQVERLCWVDAERNGGAVSRYEVFHLPALFLVSDGQFHGALNARLSAEALNQALEHAAQRTAEELP